MESSETHSRLASLAWQIDLGADEAIGDAPVNRYTLPARVTAPAPPAVAPAAAPQRQEPHRAPPVKSQEEDAVAAARAAAAAAGDLDSLRAALAAFDHCDLKRGARHLVFSDGTPGAPVMIVGEAPGRDEDRAGKPFVGRAGKFLDLMLAAIGLGRAEAEDSVYITNVLPWRPPQNREPSASEIAMMRPFVARHIALARPQVLVVMGNVSAQCLLGRTGITRLRGQWTEAENLPALPMFHPAYLLRNPIRKREAWEDLLALKARLADG